MTGVENAELENAGPTKYGKPNITLNAATSSTTTEKDLHPHAVFESSESQRIGAHSSKLCDALTDTDSDTSEASASGCSSSDEPRLMKNNLTLTPARTPLSRPSPHQTAT